MTIGDRIFAVPDESGIRDQVFTTRVTLCKTDGSTDGISFNIADDWDDVLITYDSTTDTYQYYKSGSLVKTILVTYSDATKEVVTRIQYVTAPPSVNYLLMLSGDNFALLSGDKFKYLSY